ncbi:MAG: nucleotide exchange factor GrpE [Longimicrobiales bacterium]
MIDETQDKNERVQTAEPDGIDLPPEGSEEDADGSVVSDEIAALQSLLADASGKYIRLAADFDNYRKRVDRSRADMVTQAQSSLIRRLLDVLDDLERVAHHADPKASADALAQGVSMVERKFRGALESAGVEEVPVENARFDPQTMEAVASVPAEKPEQDETVSDVFQKGYRFNGILIRPARVRVRKHE